MYFWMGLSIGACIGVLITLSVYSREREALERRLARKDKNEDENDEIDVSFYHGNFTLRFHKDDLEGFIDEDALPQPLLKGANKETKVVKAYASKKPVKIYTAVFAMLFGLCLWVVFNFTKEAGSIDGGPLLMSGVFFLVILSPFVGYAMFLGLSQRKAVILGNPLLEFTPEGLTCHSTKCGNVQKILWSDVIGFWPKLPNFGIRVSVDMAYKRPIDEGAIFTNYTVNPIDLELTEFIDLLEFYTELEAGPI